MFIDMSIRKLSREVCCNIFKIFEGLIPILDGEIAVANTDENFRLIYGVSTSNVRSLNELLGSPKEATSNVVTHYGVSFHRRLRKGRPTWAFAEADLDSVKKLLDAETDMLPIQPTDIELSIEGITEAFPNIPHKYTYTIVSQLKKGLIEAKKARDISQRYLGINFMMRYRAGTAKKVLAFSKDDISTILKIFRIENAYFTYDKPADDELLIMANNQEFKDLLQYPEQAGFAVQKLYESLGDPNTATDRTINYNDMNFFRRQHKNEILWTYKKDDIELLNTVLEKHGALLKIRELQDGEVMISRRNSSLQLSISLGFIDALEQLLHAVAGDVKRVVTVSGVNFTRRIDQESMELCFAVREDDSLKIYDILGIEPLSVHEVNVLDRLGPRMSQEKKILNHLLFDSNLTTVKRQFKGIPLTIRHDQGRSVLSVGVDKYEDLVGVL